MLKFQIYKGLQKPIVFKGFKGKFILWAAGSLVSGFVAGALMGRFTNIFFGIVSCIGIILGGLFYTNARQKKGLHCKARMKGIHCFPTDLSKMYKK